MDLLRLNAFPSVAPNAVSSLVTSQLLDYSLLALFLVRGGTTFTTAHLSGIRLRVDGKDVVPALTGAQLEDMNEYDGLTTVANHNPLWFSDPTARTIRGQHLSALDFSMYRRPLELEVTIGGATAPTLEAWALVGPPKIAMGVGFNEYDAATFRALIRSVIQPAAAVTRQQYPISLGSAPGARIRRINFFHANLTRVELKKQSLSKWDDVPVALNSAVAQQFARVPQSGLYVLDRIMDGNQGEAEPTVQSDGRPWNLSAALTTSGGDTITAVADVLTNHALL